MHETTAPVTLQNIPHLGATTTYTRHIHVMPWNLPGQIADGLG